jgi:hypothetical protein
VDSAARVSYAPVALALKPKQSGASADSASDRADRGVRHPHTQDGKTNHTVSCTVYALQGRMRPGEQACGVFFQSPDHPTHTVPPLLRTYWEDASFA